MKNNTGGNKHKKKKIVTEVIHDRELTLKTDGQEYGQVTKLLGNCRFDVDCLDGKSRLCHVRGVLRKKKVFVKLGDLVIASLRDFEDGKADIIHVYHKNEIHKLKNLGEIPESVRINEDIVVDTKQEDIGVEFYDSDDEEFLKQKEAFKTNFENNFQTI